MAAAEICSNTTLPLPPSLGTASEAQPRDQTSSSRGPSPGALLGHSVVWMWCPLGTEMTLVGSIRILEGCSLCPCLLLNATQVLTPGAKQSPQMSHPVTVHLWGPWPGQLSPGQPCPQCPPGPLTLCPTLLSVPHELAVCSSGDKMDTTHRLPSRPKCLTFLSEAPGAGWSARRA